MVSTQDNAVKVYTHESSLKQLSSIEYYLDAAPAKATDGSSVLQLAQADQIGSKIWDV